MTRTLMRSGGVALAVGFMVLSAVINWRYGATMASTLEDRWIYAGASLLVDGAKSAMPFFVLLAAQARRWLRAIAATVFWLACTGYSLSSLVGFSEQHRASHVGALAGQKLQHETANATLQRTRLARAELGNVAAPTVVSATIARLKQDRRWVSTSGCNTVTDAGGRKFCQEVADAEMLWQKGLNAELLDQEERRLTAEVAQLSIADATEQGDSRAVVVARMTGWPVKVIENGLVVLFIAVMEIGSGLGLFIALVDGGKENREDERSRHAEDNCDNPAGASSVSDIRHELAAPTMPSSPAPSVQVFGDVGKFALATFAVKVGERMESTRAHISYCRWCSEANIEPLDRKTFDDHLASLAKAIGAGVEQSDGHTAIIDMAV